MSQQGQPSNGGITLQINSAAALERLIGGDNEMEVALRRSIVAEFIKNHLDALAKAAVRDDLNRMERMVQEAVRRHVVEESGSSWAKTVSLTPEMQQKIRNEVDKQVSIEINKFIGGEVERFRSRIVPQINAMVDRDFERRVSDGVKLRLEQLRALLPLGEPETRKVTVPT